MKEFFKRVARYIKRWSIFLFKNTFLSFSERFRIVIILNKKKKDAVIRRFILERLRTDADKRKFFLIANSKIYFEPDYEIIDKEYHLQGVVSVLIETFLLPDYFSQKVYLSKGDVVFDLGSNIGTTVSLFSSLVGEEGKVFAFEPVTNKVLELNVKENNLFNVEIVSKGVSDISGSTEIEISDYGLDSSIAKREHTKSYYCRKKAIDLISLDAFVEERKIDRIDFIKVDIEGLEELAIKGAIQIIKKYRPKWSISSYHIDWRNEPQHRKLTKLLKDMGYKIEEDGEQHIYAW